MLSIGVLVANPTFNYAGFYVRSSDTYIQARLSQD